MTYTNKLARLVQWQAVVVRRREVKGNYLVALRDLFRNMKFPLSFPAAGCLHVLLVEFLFKVDKDIGIRLLNELDDLLF